MGPVAGGSVQGLRFPTGAVTRGYSEACGHTLDAVVSKWRGEGQANKVNKMISTTNDDEE